MPARYPVRGLLARRASPQLVAPREDYATVVRREAPKDVAPDEAPVVRFPGGVAPERANGLPLLLEETGDGGVRRVG